MYEEYWKLDGHQVDIYSITSSPGTEKLSYIGCQDWFGYKTKDNAPVFGIGYLSLEQMVKVINKSYDIIWIVLGLSYPILCQLPLAKLASGTRVICSLHIDIHNYIKLYKPEMIEFMKICMDIFHMTIENVADLFITPNSHILKEFGEITTPTAIFPTGVDKRVFYPKANTRKKNWIIYAGRLAIEKNLKSLENIFDLLKNYKLLIFGDGPLREELEQRWKDKPVKFMGSVSKIKLASYYRRAKLTIQPSLSETFGFTILESLACGTPCVYRGTPVMLSIFRSFGPHLTLSASETLDRDDLKKISFFLQDSRNHHYDIPDWSEAAKKTLEIFSNK